MFIKLSFTTKHKRAIIFIFIANELRAWLLYYSLPCLEDILPKTYLDHFALLVEAIHNLLKESISKEQIEWAKSCLDLFYKYFERLYGRLSQSLQHTIFHFSFDFSFLSFIIFIGESYNNSGSLLRNMIQQMNCCISVTTFIWMISFVHKKSLWYPNNSEQTIYGLLSLSFRWQKVWFKCS